MTLNHLLNEPPIYWNLYVQMTKPLFSIFFPPTTLLVFITQGQKIRVTIILRFEPTYMDSTYYIFLSFSVLKVNGRMSPFSQTGNI